MQCVMCDFRHSVKKCNLNKRMCSCSRLPNWARIFNKTYLSLLNRCLSEQWWRRNYFPRNLFSLGTECSVNPGSHLACLKWVKWSLERSYLKDTGDQKINFVVNIWDFSCSVVLCCDIPSSEMLTKMETKKESEVIKIIQCSVPRTHVVEELIESLKLSLDSPCPIN